MASSIRAVANKEKAEPLVLLVDGDAAFVAGLSEYLGNYSFSVWKSTSWDSMVDYLNTAKVDIILLEQRVGQVDMVARLADIQSLSDAPMVFLSNNKLETDRILALELGAADFLLKPISGREIVARIRAHLRRTSLSSSQAAEAQPSWRIASKERCLYTPEGAAVQLTGAEFTLLEHLVKAAGQPLGRENLTQEVFRRPYRAEDRSIDNLIYQVRQKISGAGGGEVIIAVRGQGYAFTGFESRAPAAAKAVASNGYSSQ